MAEPPDWIQGKIRDPRASTTEAAAYERLDKLCREIRQKEGELRNARVAIAFDMIARAHTITILTLDEMEAVVKRALDGEFDVELQKPAVAPV